MKKILTLCLFVCAAFAAAPAAAQSQQGGQAGVYYRDGARFALEGRLAEAAKAFEQAAALDPENGNAFYALGNVYAEQGRWADAVNAYYKAVSLNKQDVEAYNNLGVALGMRGQYIQAAAAFERAIKIYPKWAEPYYHLSEARRALDQQGEARAAYERALRLRPDYASRPPRGFTAAGAKPSAPGRGQILEAMNALNLGPGGTESAATAPAPSPRAAAPAPSPTPSPRAANTANTAGNTPSAAPSGTRSANSPANAPARAATPAGSPVAGAAAPRPAPDAASPYEVGMREARAGRQREAVAAFRQAVILDRGNAAAYRGLGDAYAALGNWRESVDAYEQAARLAPGDAETYERLGRSYAKLRETPDGGRVADAGGPRPAARPAAADAAARPAPDDPDPTAVYRLGPGDVLDIRLLNGRERGTTAYAVSPTGLLDHPVLKEPVPVAGLTADEAAARLGSALGLRAGGPDPEIAVGVREYVSHAVIVGGMVKEGGTKILQREGVPLYVIIAHAQPLPGAGQALLFARATGQTAAVDLSDAAAMKTLVRPGDVITVRELPKQFVYVAGAVRQPGQREFHSGMTLTQALLAAGGVNPPGAGAVTVTRQGADGRLSTARFDLAQINAGRAPDPPLRPDDRVEVLR